MTTPDPTENPTETGHRAESAPPRFRVQVSYPDRESIVVEPGGEIDAETIDHLEEVLWPRLSAQVRTIVVDLSGVGFLSVAGMQLLKQAHLDARSRGVELRLVTAHREVTHALEVAGLDTAMRCFPTTAQALARFDES
ncbi:STAS domain-containing protein [Saccharopolyspora gregorii]|uniref:STAS domain-containing protein n=1 Tax=Saccharopolyspora gregorii TaxID=33914 RepID=UPI0021AD3F78|nr:STAS domain-containing protein [Saccharopolyspora gregorii]